MKSGYKGDGFDRYCYLNQKGFAESDSTNSLIQIIIDSNKNSLHLAYYDYNRY